MYGEAVEAVEEHQPPAEQQVLLFLEVQEARARQQRAGLASFPVEAEVEVVIQERAEPVQQATSE